MSAFLDKPLDDMEPRDIAIGFAETFDDIAKKFANEGDSDWEAEMIRAAGVLRAWARFGTWYTKGDLRNVARHALFLALGEEHVDYKVADRALREYVERGQR